MRYIVRTYVRGSRKLSLNTSLVTVKRHNAVLQRVNEPDTSAIAPAREQSRRGVTVRGTPWGGNACGCPRGGSLRDCASVSPSANACALLPWATGR